MGCGDVLRSPWMVVVSAFVIQVYSVGIEYTFGILLVEIDKEFDNQKANWIGSIQLMCYYLMGVIISPFKTYLGWRKIAILGYILIAIGLVSTRYCYNVYGIYFTYGVLTGAGAGLGYLASTVSAQEAIWYNRSLATGITAVGGGVGVILLSELRAITITAAGWRNSLLVELAFVIITFPFIYFLKPSKNRELSESQQESDLDQSSLEKSSGCNDDVATTNKNCINDETSQLVPSNPHVTHSFYRNPVLYLMIMVSLLLTNAFTAPNYYLPSRVQNDLGMSSEKSAALILITGLINIPTRFMCGWAGSYGVRVRLVMAVSINMLTAVATCLMPVITVYALLVFYAVTIGIFGGGFSTLIPVLLVDVFGEVDIHIPFGIYMASSAISQLLGIPFIGYLEKLSGNYNASYIAIGSMQLSTLLFVALIGVIHNRKKKN